MQTESNALQLNTVVSGRLQPFVMPKITAEVFKQKTGREPEQDDLERVNCNCDGSVGHWSCGWCDEHDSPRFECGCRVKIIDI